MAGVPENFDMVHCLNDIAITSKPWIVTFEAIIPRTFQQGRKRLADMVRHRLIKDNCHKVIGQSYYALKKLAKRHESWKPVARLMDKSQVIYPSIDIKDPRPKSKPGKNLSIVFVGNSFARKGGVSAVRLAQKALNDNFPITVHIVSRLQLGAYTDALDNNLYKDDIQLLDLPNVVYHKEIENSKVLELLQQSDFQFMPTIGDTFGFSIVEGLSYGTPAIVTNTCAMPELVQHDHNGYLLDVEVNETNDIAWLKAAHNTTYRSSDSYWEQLDKTYSDLANQAYQLLETFSQRKDDYERLSAASIEHVKKHHDSHKMSQAYDAIYDEVLE